MKTLVILSSILGNRSHSKELADHMVARIKQVNPAAVITTRDIGAEPLPYFDGATAGALLAALLALIAGAAGWRAGSRRPRVARCISPISTRSRDSRRTCRTRHRIRMRTPCVLRPVAVHRPRSLTSRSVHRQRSI